MACAGDGWAAQASQGEKPPVTDAAAVIWSLNSCPVPRPLEYADSAMGNSFLRSSLQGKDISTGRILTAEFTILVKT